MPLQLTMLVAVAVVAASATGQQQVAELGKRTLPTHRAATSSTGMDDVHAPMFVDDLFLRRRMA